MQILNRAKSFYSDEYFISKDIKFELEMMYLRVNGVWRECEESTRSINFEDMLDSQGNKIFASLQEDGKGGDVLNSGYGEVIIAIYEEGMIKFRFEEALPYNHTTIDEIEDEDFLSFYEVWQIRDKLKSEVIGIQE